MNKLQAYILQIVDYFDAFCKQNNIKYYLMGGSALGAARHHGFIPWDDDFDVFLSFEDYLKLISLKDIFDNDKFCVQPLNTQENPLFMGKVRMKNTLLIEGDADNYNPNYCHGIYIDIMVLYDASPFLLGRKKQFLFAKILSANRLLLDGYKPKSIIKKIFSFFSKAIVKLFGINHFYKYVSKTRKNAKYYCHIFGRANYKKSFYPKEWFLENVDITFERKELPIMIEYSKYLSLRYGEHFMDMPDKKTLSKYPSHAFYVNFAGSNDERECERV